jgi:hypothetical protein
MIRKFLIVLAAAAAILAATVSPASARPVPDNPIDCGPGYDLVGATCVAHPRLKLDDDSIGEWAIAALGIGLLFFL